MTTSFLENVEFICFPKLCQDTVRFILVIPQKKDLEFESKLYIKKSDIKNLNFLFLFHRLSFYILEKRKKIGGHHTNYLSGGSNLTPPPQISRIIQYKTLRSVIFLSFI